MNRSLLHASIPEWQERVRMEDPDEWIPRLWAYWDGLRRGEGQAALAWLPDIDTLKQAVRRTQTVAGPLAGVPCFLKDLFDLAGVRTLAGAISRADSPVAETDSKLVEVCHGHGLWIAGKTHMHEFAYGLSGENPHYGDCPHPSITDALSGGSSSGSAWAVGKGLVPLAFGTDTGGSIRVPAAFCGIFGYRKNPDDWAEKGVFPLAPTYDTAGWFTETGSDMVRTLKELLSNEESPDGRRALRREGLWFQGWPEGGKDSNLKLLEKTAERLGCVAPEKWTRRLQRDLAGSALHYSVLQSREAFQVHASILDEQQALYDPGVWQRIDRGRHWTALQIRQALDHEQRVRDTLGEILEEYAFLALPVAPFSTPRRSDFTQALRDALLQYTTPGSLALSPTLVLPLLLEDKRSLGLQILFSNPDAAGPCDALQRVGLA